MGEQGTRWWLSRDKVSRANHFCDVVCDRQVSPPYGEFQLLDGVKDVGRYVASHLSPCLGLSSTFAAALLACGN